MSQPPVPSSGPRPEPRPWARACLALLATLAIACGASAVDSATEPEHASRPAPPPVELIESVPVQSPLGNPAFRSAASAWPELLRSASSTLDIEEMYLSNWPGEPLEPVLEAITAAAKRGVHVRLLLDSKMHRTYPQPADSLGLVPGITVRVIDIGKITGGIQHAKFFIVDGRVVYLGSQNFDWRSLEHIHELGVAVRDARVARAFEDVFEMDWGAAGLQAQGADTSAMIGWPERAPVASELPYRIGQSPGDTVEVWPSWSPKAFSPDSALWDRDAVVRAIDSARSEIVAQSLRYSAGEGPNRDDVLDVALRRAAARGVRVKLLISDWEAGGKNMKGLIDLATVSGVEVRLSHVPEWNRAYIPFARVEHCKYMVVDTLTTWVGTANWEPGYFHKLRNVAVTLRNRPIAREARRTFAASWAANDSLRVGPQSNFVARPHEMTPPPGRAVYGR